MAVYQYIGGQVQKKVYKRTTMETIWDDGDDFSA